MPVEAVYADRFHLFEGLDRLQFNEAADKAFFGFTAPLSEYVSPPVVVTSRTIPGPQGDIPVRLYWPEGHNPATDARLGLVWFHGGAFVMGDLDMGESDIASRELAHRANAVVMSVDYRLCTPERHMPVPQIDGLAATEWFDANRSELGVRQGIFIGGGSAGGCLAAGVAMKLLELGDDCLAGVLPMYPVIYAAPPQRSPELAEKCRQIPAFLVFDDEWARNQNLLLLGGRSLDQAEPWEFPGAAESYAGLPPVLIINSEYDSLRQHGEDWAAELARDGVDVQVVCEAGQLHGHLGRLPGDCQGAERSLQRIAEFMKAH